MTTIWTDDRRAECKRLWIDGVSATDIARSLGGITRSAVVGLVRRADLVRIPLRDRPPSERTPGARPRMKQPKEMPAPVIAEPPEPDVVGYTVANMPRHACHWPLSGAGADMVMCGHASEGTYCEGHARVAYITLTVRQKASLRSLMGWAARR